MAWPEPPGDLSYLDLLHQANDRMRDRAVELQARLKQIISETADDRKRAWAVQQLKFFERMEHRLPRRF
jgi:hypothetical protein